MKSVECDGKETNRNAITLHVICIKFDSADTWQLSWRNVISFTVLLN